MKKKTILFILFLTVFCGKVFASEVRCLTSTLYNEARGESILGQKAVAAVVFNRVKSKQKFFKANTVCKTVSKKAQFAHKTPKKVNKKIYAQLEKRAKKWHAEFRQNKFRDVTGGSLYFASKGYIHKGKKKTVKIGGHQFFK